MQNEDEDPPRGTKRGLSNASVMEEKRLRPIDIQEIHRLGGLRTLVHTLPFQSFATRPPENAVVCVEIPNLPYQPSLVIGRYRHYGVVNMVDPYNFIIVEHDGQESAQQIIPTFQPYQIDFETARWTNARPIFQRLIGAVGVMGGRQSKSLRHRKGRAKSFRRTRRKGRRTRSKW